MGDTTWPRRVTLTKGCIVVVFWNVVVTFEFQGVKARIKWLPISRKPVAWYQVIGNGEESLSDEKVKRMFSFRTLAVGNQLS